MLKSLLIGSMLLISMAANAEVMDRTMTPFRVTASTQFTYDLPKAFPTTFATWQKIVPDIVRSQDWLYNVVHSTASPIRDVTVNGQPMKFGTVCKPHDCGDNIAGILFSPQQDRVVGRIHIFDKIGTLGTPTAVESACIDLFMDRHQSTTCVSK